MSEVENWCIEARNLTGILRAAVDEFERISEAYADVRDMGANSDKETIDTCYGNLVDVLNEVKGLQAGGRRIRKTRRSNRSNRSNRRNRLYRRRH
jgi:hypothetical protein